MRIKCPHCNGKGFLELNSAMNMTCGWCMGQGELDLEIVPTEPQTEAEIEKKWENTVWDTDVYLDDIDGKEPMTKEEWLKSLDTEGLVDLLYEVHKGGASVERQAYIEKHKERTKMQIRGWLKEIHHGNNDM